MMLPTPSISTDGVTVVQEDLRVAAVSDAGWGPGEDDVAWFEAGEVRDGSGEPGKIR